jgi:hypothetical protein
MPKSSRSHNAPRHTACQVALRYAEQVLGRPEPTVIHYLERDFEALVLLAARGGGRFAMHLQRSSLAPDWIVVEDSLDEDDFNRNVRK